MARPDTVPTPVLAVFVAPLDVPVRLDSAPRGLEAPDVPSNAPAPTAACDRPVPDVDPGVDILCRACGTEDITCEDAVWTVLPAWVVVAWVTAPAWPATPPGLVVWGGGANVLKVEADAELAA
ncbi:MAG: hypothetical protein ACXVYI_14760 [Mycobacterium sp.]